MPDRTRLKVGDVIKLNAVPTADLQQRARELEEGLLEDAGMTADTIERILAQNPVVTIDRVDEYGQPWFDCNVPNEQGEIEEHSLAIMGDESWSYVAPAG